jgi:uncharacterized membrane protein YheB (UPF0754 family)
MFEIPLKIWLMPVTGFIIGYFTNYLAIKMLFHPRKKRLGIQGVIPKRRRALASKIASITPNIMPPQLLKLKEVPFFGNKILEKFQEAVEGQINSLSLEELENIVFKVMKKEMKFIVWVGGIIGLLIGVIQALIIIYL